MAFLLSLLLRPRRPRSKSAFLPDRGPPARIAFVQPLDHLGERLAPGPRHDAEGLADPATIQDRIGRPPRWGRVSGRGDLPHPRPRGRVAAVGARPHPGGRATPRLCQVEDRFGKATPGYRAGAGEIKGAPL